MIYLIRGTILEKDPDRVVVDTGNIAYEAGISMQTYSGLPNTGGEGELYTYFSYSENGAYLYGFATLEEKRVFLLLTSVSKIGPKTAQSILSGISVDRLKQAVASEDAGLLATVPGIGKKTAERIIVELKDKFEDVFVSKPEEGQEGLEDVVSALINFGYSRNDAIKAAKKVFNKDNSFDENIRKAFQVISGQG